RNCKYDVNIKEELVQWATQDNKKTSLNDLSFEQANKILIAQGDKPTPIENWALFDKNNSKHKYILSLCYQLGLTTELKGRTIADTNKLSEWIKSERCPVQKPLKQMTTFELSRVITALESMVQKKWR
ncbi:MAG TPA: hypothetical protein VIG40_02870, partial [Tissierellaceae bacterium]